MAALLSCWLLFYLAGYSLLGVPDFPWHYGPPAIVISLFVWMALQDALTLGLRVAHSHRGFGGPAITWTVAIVASAMLVTKTPLGEKLEPRTERIHVLAGKWLRQNARPGDTIVAYEVGMIAYLSDLRTVDLLGLTEPQARVHLRQRDCAWASRELPTYVFSNERSRWPVTDAIFKKPAFVFGYRPVLRLPHQESADYVMYRYVGQDRSAAPEGRREADWIDVYHPASTRAGLVVDYSLTVRTLAATPWRVNAPDAPWVTYEWRDEQGRPEVAEWLRTPLPCDVGPGLRVLIRAS